MSNSLSVPASRRAPLAQILRHVLEADVIALTTHVNADGDGAGCEAALAAWLIARGKRVLIANPTPFPDMFRWLLDARAEVVDVRDDQDAARVQDAGLLVVLDTGEPSRIERVLRLIRHLPAVLLDHHPPSASGIHAVAALQDVSACATGELLFDLLSLDEAGGAWPREVAEGIYTAIVTDTGSFRYANTTPRTHAIAGELLARGVDPEAAYRRLFGSVPMRRAQLLAAALQTLQRDDELPISWITVPREAMQQLGAGADDLDGVVEHARSIEGTEVAILFRETNGSTKVSFRSNGELDVNAIAREFGGGGHVKAAGALIGGGLDQVRPRVLSATRDAVRRMLEAAA